MLALPLAKLTVGVNTAVRVSALPTMALKEPPETNTSPALPFHVKLPPGSSENVNVMMAVSPAFRRLTLVVINTLGGVSSEGGGGGGGGGGGVSAISKELVLIDEMLPAKSTVNKL